MYFISIKWQDDTPYYLYFCTVLLKVYWKFIDLEKHDLCIYLAQYNFKSRKRKFDSEFLLPFWYK